MCEDRWSFILIFLITLIIGVGPLILLYLLNPATEVLPFFLVGTTIYTIAAGIFSLTIS